MGNRQPGQRGPGLIQKTQIVFRLTPINANQ
jgi:hypothetical protein